jgi:SAM-dependent methyltransferase
MDIADGFRRAYEARYREHGDSYKALGWESWVKADKRYQVMLDIVHSQSASDVSLLDFGCGLGHMVEYIKDWSPLKHVEYIDYHGLDISLVFIDACRNKYPDVTFHCLDISRDNHLSQLPTFDYVLVNGVFTEKFGVNWDTMWAHCQNILTRLWSITGHGLAVNTMSSHVDWERDDLFHLPFHTMADFVRGELSHHFLFRQDYGLHEYTTYVYREAS